MLRIIRRRASPSAAALSDAGIAWPLAAAARGYGRQRRSGSAATARGPRAGTAGRRPPPAAAWLWPVAATLAVLAGLPCWGGPGFRPGTVLSLLATVCVALLCALLVAASPSRAGRERARWRLIAVGLALYAVAGLWLGLRVLSNPIVPVPYWTDAIWMCAYACLVAGVLLTGASGRSRPGPGAILDGLLVALGVMTIAAATVFGGLIGIPGHGLLREATALSYPLWDLTLVGVSAGVLALGGRRRRLTGDLVAVGGLLLAAADVAYLHRAASGDFSPGAWYHPIYMLAWLAIAAAAWTPAGATRPSRNRPGWQRLAPGLVVAIAATVLVWDHYERRSTAAVVLSAIALAVVVARTLMSFVELEGLADARRLALLDDLTGLPNRRRFLRALRSAAAATRAAGPEFAIVILDVDRFKEVNDTLGHEVGDRLLTQIGQRLRARLEPDDLVARVGGDEFAVLTAAGESARECGLRAARTVLSALRAPIEVGPVAFPTQASIGIALCPAHGREPDALLRRADVAMYQAKATVGGFEVYSSERDEFSVDRLSLGADLQHAAERGEMGLVFQPIAEVATGRVTRAEALVRWRHPTRGLLLPAEFLPIAERIGVMRAVRGAVLRQATEQCAAWQRQGVRLGVAVNLAASDLLDAGLPAAIREVLAASGIDPELLRLEITEHGILDDPIRARATLNELRGLGVGVSIDDFGTGYSSLVYLRDLPVDELKIDQTFVRGITGEAEDAAIVRSTIQLGRDLGLRVVAEGVEDEATLELVSRWGAHAAQGRLIGAPTAGDELARPQA
jgi:diguanylate cyclase (GGDEF)-like protein